MNQTVGDWGAAVVTSVAGALALLLAAIPKIIGFLAVLLVGWFVASLIAMGIGALIRTIGFNGLAERAGLADFVRKTGTKSDPTGVLTLTVKWFIRLIVLVVAFDALGLPSVSDILRGFVMWLPNLVVAMVVLVLGGIAARAAASLVRGTAAEAEIGNPNVLANVASVLVWAFAIIVAVNQIGVAQTLVNALFIAFVGALALALGLSFGLGGRETAADIVHDWREQARRGAEKARGAGVVIDVGREEEAKRAAEEAERRAGFRGTAAAQPKPKA